MKVAKIKVDGYRLLNGFVMEMRDDLSLVIGKNNTGKTSLLNILSSVLPEGSPNFAFEDFSLGLQVALRKALEKDIPQAPEQPILINLELEVQYDEKDNLRNLSKLMIDLSPEARTVHLRFRTELGPNEFSRLYGDVRKNLEAIEEFTKSLDEKERGVEIQRFLSKKLGGYLSSSIVSFDPQDETASLDLTKEAKLLRRVLRLEYVSARRSVENRTAGKNGRTAGRALSQLSSDYFDDHTGGSEETPAFIQLAAQAAATDRAFTKTYKSVFEDVVGKIRRFGGTTALNADIHVVSDIQPDLLLKNSTSVRYGDPDSMLPEDHNGLGYLNLIAIIMEIEIRLLRMKGDGAQGMADINLLVIEEPEAHTHPQLQYIFIKQIKELILEHKKGDGLKLQTVLTTHSAHITAESDFSDIKYFRRIADRVEARNMTDLEEKYGKDTKSYRFLKQYLTLTRAELFFADKAVLIEGDTERILMRAMMRKVDAAEPDHESPLNSQNISIVEVGAHSQVFDHFIHFTGLKTLIITDIDSAGIFEKEIEKDGKKEIKRSLRACAVADGTHTMNGALKHYLGLTKSELDAEGDLGDLRKRSAAQKQVSKTDTWAIDPKDGAIFVAYQTKEADYEARSYEDAFIHINREFIMKNIGSFHGLKKTHHFADASMDAYALADKCVRKKTHFALDVIYHGGTDGNSEWKTPGYITEGLRWLRDAR